MLCKKRSTRTTFRLVKVSRVYNPLSSYKSFALNALIGSTRIGEGVYLKTAFDTYTNVSRPFVAIPFPLLYSLCTTSTIFVLRMVLGITFEFRLILNSDFLK